MELGKKEIIADIDTHIKRCGGTYSSWYTGVSKDAGDRLFNAHKVKQKKDAWIYRKASSSQVARECEEYFVKTLGTDGGMGGGDDTCDMVYAYKKQLYTKP